MTKNNPNNQDINEMLEDFGAKNESELENNLLEEWDKVECSICHRKISMFEATFINGEIPICKEHCV